MPQINGNIISTLPISRLLNGFMVNSPNANELSVRSPHTESYGRADFFYEEVTARRRPIVLWMAPNAAPAKVEVTAAPICAAEMWSRSR